MREHMREHTDATRPGRWRQLATAVCAVAMLLPAAGVLAAESDPEQRLDEVREQMERARQGLEQVEQQRTVTLADLERIDAELRELDARLAAAQAELAEAEGGLATAESRLTATTSELVATEDELARTRERLAGEREVFAERTRASYMHGSPALAGAVLDAGDIAEFGRSLAYVERIMAHDRDRVRLVTGLVREVEASSRDLEALQERQGRERAAAQVERDQVAELVAAEQALHDQVAAERQRRTVVLARLDADRETYSQMVAALEAESAQLEEELRRLAEQEAREAEAAARAARDRVERAGARTGRLARPADGPITSGYGWRTHPIHGSRRFHAGVDFGGGFGAPIYAAEDGTVVSAGWRGGYGRTVVVNHGGGLATLYAHQARFVVSAGQRVTRGQVIGAIGSSGLSTGPHLHFEVRVNGQHRNPMDYL